MINSTKCMKTKVLVLLVIIISIVLSMFVSNNTIATAQSNELNFDTTNVLDDLRSSKVGGNAFNLQDYPFKDNKVMEVISFVEYCYSYKSNMQNNYGLYLYVYNPKGLKIFNNSKQNKVQMAVSYDQEGKPIDYVKLDLKLCSKAEENNYTNLFYKFKVIDKEVNGTTFIQRVNSNERRYDISGIELLTFGSSNATEYNVGGVYKFIGYAEGYGPDSTAKSTLTSKVEFLETVELSVNHTFYRTKTSSRGAGYQNQLDSVYFAVPKRLFEDYGNLQRIKAEWYEYKTNDIVVTSNNNFYNSAKPYIGVETGELDKYGIPKYNNNIGYSLGQSAGDYGGGLMGAKWGWNLGSDYLHPACLSLQYLFLTSNISDYDPYADITISGGIPSNKLYDYIKSYNKSFDKGTLPIKNNSISADLFADDIDEYRKADNEFGKIQYGYSYYDFDANIDLQKLSSWQEGNPSFWDNWINWGLWNSMVGNIPNEEGREISPIIMVKQEDLLGNKSQVSDNLLINSSDIESLRQFYNKANSEEKVVVLFRFAKSDYYSADIDIIELGKGFLGSNKFTSGQAYRAWESVFFDFDIIQLSFQKDGQYTIIPVVSSPIDVVNGITPPVNFPKDTKLWKLILGGILLIIILIILAPILSLIIQLIFWILLLPFKLLKSLIKGIKPKGKSDG